MRKVLGAMLALALAGCAANSQISQTPSSPGTYNLIAVDGQAVPQAIGSGEEVVAGTLVLNQDRSFEMKLQMRAQMTAKEPLNFQRQFSGTYTTSEIGVQLVWRGGIETSGAFFGKTLRIFNNGTEYLFVK
jgi:hypothetical protein